MPTLFTFHALFSSSHFCSTIYLHHCITHLHHLFWQKVEELHFQNQQGLGLGISCLVELEISFFILFFWQKNWKSLFNYPFLVHEHICKLGEYCLIHLYRIIMLILRQKWAMGFESFANTYELLGNFAMCIDLVKLGLKYF